MRLLAKILIGALVLAGLTYVYYTEVKPTVIFGLRSDWACDSLSKNPGRSHEFASGILRGLSQRDLCRMENQHPFAGLSRSILPRLLDEG